MSTLKSFYPPQTPRMSPKGLTEGTHYAKSLHPDSLTHYLGTTSGDADIPTVTENLASQGIIEKPLVVISFRPWTEISLGRGGIHGVSPFNGRNDSF